MMKHAPPEAERRDTRLGQHGAALFQEVCSHREDLHRTTEVRRQVALSPNLHPQCILPEMQANCINQVASIAF